MKRAVFGLGLVMLAGAGCNSASANPARALGRPLASTPQLVDLDEDSGAWDSDGPSDEVESDAEPASSTGLELDLAGSVTPEPGRDAVTRRIARRMVTIYARPSVLAPVRGRIPMSAAFDVFGFVDGEGCTGELGWADVGGGGYACMDNTRDGERAEPLTLPKMRAGVTPFYYAEAKGDTAAPIYRNVRSMRAGEPPVSTLGAGVHDAFVLRRRIGGEVVLIDERRRAVRERDVQRFRPSQFEGRDLEDRPLPDDKVLAWVSRWPRVSTYARATVHSKAHGELAYHDALVLEPADTKGWFKLEDGGFVSTSDVRVFVPPTDRPAGVEDDEVWLDIDLRQQTLAVVRGDEPLFATLVSSGVKSPTPRGLFRIHNKLAVGSMSSDPGDEDFYDVQAVPHVQYFSGGYAIHSAYWHNGFGRPISHGCVNLSPRDAARVFGSTSPSLEPGWIHAYETSEHLGTTLRIRKGTEEVRDRRGEPETLFGA